MTLFAGLDGASISRLVRRSEFYSVIILVIVIVAFVAMAAATDFHAMLVALQQVGLPTVGGVFLLAFGNYFCRIIRFRYLLALKGFRIPLLGVIQVYLAGGAMTATPGKLGELVRLWLLRSQYGFPYRRTLPVLITDRANDVIATVLLCVLSLRAFSSYLAVTAIISSIFILGCILLMRPALLIALIGYAYGLTRIKPRLFGLARQLVRSTSDLFKLLPFAIGLGLGGVGWALECLALYLCAVTFAPNVTFEQAVFIFTFSNLVGAVSLIPGGVGGTEISMATLLVAVGLPLEQAAAVTLIIRVGTLWFGIALGYVALFSFMSRYRRSVRLKSQE